jgi:D-glycero-D-manno-heptose 1,7-bisphosphate phosphatase
MPDAPALRPAVFLDRDGTICEEVGYLNHISRFRMFDFAAAAIRKLNEARVAVFVVTNQSGVGRGLFPESLVEQVHAEMKRQLAGVGARLEDIYYCPHRADDGCDCRKPKPGLLERAAREHQLDLRRSVIVGDRHADVELAHRVGGRSVLVETGYGRGELEWNAAKWTARPDHIAQDLAHSVEWILRHIG